jgi:tetratricopeptide (TPR) repeat protein
MKRPPFINRTFLYASFLFVSIASHSQDTATIKLSNYDSLRLNTNYILPLFGSDKYYPEFNYIYHSAEKEDSDIYRTNKALVMQLPTKENHEKYFQLACALWDLKNLSEAEKMLLNIVRSPGKYYATTYHISSDVPGDTSSNMYGYGSFTYNYKNSAAILLCKIYIELKRFREALAFLNDAVNKYEVYYTCGTGYHQQQDEYTFLYASCYAGLNQNKKVLDLLLQGCVERNDAIIVKVIKIMYSPGQIEEYLLVAEKSLSCQVDSIPSMSWVTSNYGRENERSDTIHYYSGTGTMKLFGKTVTLPRPNLKDGETVTRDHFMKLFKESPFYESLHQEDKISNNKTGSVPEDL